MAEDSGAILRHISSLKDMLDKVNEEIEQNIQKTREIESEIVKHSETEKLYLDKESELMKEVSIAEFELNGLIQVAGNSAERDILKVTEGNLKLQKVSLNGVTKRFSDKMEKFINESKGFQANMLGGSSEDLVLLLKEKHSLEDESENLKMKIDTIHSSSKEYIAEILEEVNTENSKPPHCPSIPLCSSISSCSHFFILPSTMAFYNSTELDDIHQWLPLEILEDIGITNANELRTMAVIDELASRLNDILGSAMESGQRHPLPPVRAASSLQPQICGPACWGQVPGGGNRQRLLAEAPSFWGNGRTLDLPMFALAWPPLPGFVLQPAKQRGAGTGVFLPRTGTGTTHCHAPRNATPSWNAPRADSRYSKAGMPAKANGFAAKRKNRVSGSGS
ncbi:hypothetical protein PR202_gb24480 [Eleusine coracana subsp. coracana]|uniref:Uncharacterized protein n=1 Tax=Eleusine coracana subsp. coracana TaxID=191504 RepID=A0AAV5FM52_ELECO|nr:hypothetical protein PR202_gb24480 [Eleusine coracana subsp. coracana]